MLWGMKDRYGPYPKKKEKKQISQKERRILQRSYEWLKWEVLERGGIIFHIPCSEH
jgi:hypothetical protein